MCAEPEPSPFTLRQILALFMPRRVRDTEPDWLARMGNL